VFRGRKADLLKILFWDGTGLCLFTKRLEQSRFFWPVRGDNQGERAASIRMRVRRGWADGGRA
jgi:transposase